MRSRIAVPAFLVVGLMAAAIAIPTVGNAAPKHQISMTVVPNPIVVGQPVFIFGQLTGSNHGNRTVVLYHRVNPSKTFTVAGKTTTNASGFYSFTRTDVSTNRSFFVRSDGTRSRHVYERVAAALTLQANPTTTDTTHPVVFSGHVSPEKFHVGEHVYLQQQVGKRGDDWRTIKRGTIDAKSNYSISRRFGVPGDREFRVLLRGDRRNQRAASNVVTVTIQEAQRKTFTIQATPQVIDNGQSAVVSGVLYKNNTLVPDPGKTVQLWGHVAGSPYGLIGTKTTDTTGHYSFTVSPAHNTVYQARTVASIGSPVRKTAQLLEVVRYVVTIHANKTSGRVGDTVTFTGAVAPAASGHVIYLQGLGLDHDWHTIKTGHLFANSTYSLSWRLGAFGPTTFRALVPGDPANGTGHSAPVTVTVVAGPIV